MTRCPICKETMAHKAYGDVDIDICPNHGIWLDKTELFQITEQERRVVFSVLLRNHIEHELNERLVPHIKKLNRF